MAQRKKLLDKYSNKKKALEGSGKGKGKSKGKGKPYDAAEATHTKPEAPEYAQGNTCWARDKAQKRRRC